MPVYEYQCLPNHHHFEVRQGFHDDPVQICPECGGSVRRLVLPVGIVFKGSGFYATDSRNSSSKPATDAKPSEAKSSEAKSETKSDSGTEKASEKKGDSSGSTDTKSDVKTATGGDNKT